MRLVSNAVGTNEQHREPNLLQEEAALRRVIREHRRTMGSDHVTVALANIQLGDFLMNLQRYADAEAAYQKAREIYETLGVGHEMLLAMALRSLSQVVIAQDRHQEGTALGKRAIELIVDFQ